MTQSQPHHEERGISGRRKGCETSELHRENLRAALIAYHTANGEAEARRDKLIGLIESGYSNQAAAEAFGTTKSAIGKMLWRMQKRGIVINRPAVPVVKAKTAKQHVQRLKGRTPPQPRQRIEHPPMTPVSLWERTGCAFPTNDGGPFLFCNNEVHFPTSYCLFHGKLMVQGE